MNDHGQALELSSEDRTGDPAVAFDALRNSVEKLARDVGGEITVVRKAVEAAFEEFERFQQPTDYGPELGRMAQEFAFVAQQLEAIEKTPALKQGPDFYGRFLDNAADRISANTGRMFEARERGLQRVEENLMEIARSARGRRIQDRWLLGAFVAGIVIGGTSMLLGPRLLPGSTDMAIASIVMNSSRWEAGMALMKSGSFKDWNSIVTASDLVRTNTAALAACVEAATKTKRDQSCPITVAVPARSADPKN